MSGKEWDREPRNIGHLITRARRRGDRRSRRGFIASVQRGSTMRSIHFARPSCRSSSPLPSRRRKLHLLLQPDGVGDRSVRGNAHGIRGHDVSGPHGVSSSFEFRAYLSAGARPLYDGKTLSAEVRMPTLPIKAFAVLALGLVTIAPSFALEDNQCYRSCKARCVARYACEGRHPGPNCFTNFNKCRTSCWRMCRHLTGFLPKAS